MDLTQFSTLFTDQNILNFFFKAFGIVFSAIFLFYAIVLVRQIGELNKTLRGHSASILTFISFIELIFAFVLIYLAIFTL